MAGRVVGLDIGTHAVRAVELTLGRDDATLSRFGQVALPVGAVRDGEVADPPAVSAALRRLWSEAGFKARDVIVGVGNQRVVVRHAELPELSDEDLRSAISFEVAELIPIPMDEAILDYQVLERYVGAEDQPMMRLLLVAAQRDMVRSLLAALEGAGLSASMVDAVPFALLRSLVRPAADLIDEPGAAEALVCVGGGVTNVVVHEHGVPRFVRILTVGGSDITDAIAGELGVDVDTAEDLKRRSDHESFDQLEARAGAIVNDRLTPLLEEIRGSLDYYLAQSDASPVARVLLTGGGSRLRGFRERLQEQVGIPVETAHPITNLRIGRTGLSDDDLAAAEPLLAVPIGLGLAGRPAESGRRLSLLPREVAEVREQRRMTVLVGAGVGALATLLVGVWALQGSQVSNERIKAEAAEAQSADLQRKIGQMQGAAGLETQLQQRRQMVTAALGDDVAWTRLLQEVATVIPNDVWLTSFAGNKTGGTGGTITVSAMGFDHTSAARWLLRVGDLPSVSGLWLPSSTKQGQGTTSLVTFQSTANLTPKARSDRAARYLGDEGR